MKYLCTSAIYHKTAPALPPAISRMCTIELGYYWLRKQVFFYINSYDSPFVLT